MGGGEKKVSSKIEEWKEEEREMFTNVVTYETNVGMGVWGR